MLESQHKKKSTTPNRNRKESLRASTKDGESLKVVVDNGIMNGMNPKAVHENYSQF